MSDRIARGLAALLQAAVNQVTGTDDPPPEVQVTFLERLPGGGSCYRLRLEARGLSLVGCLALDTTRTPQQRRHLLHLMAPVALFGEPLPGRRQRDSSGSRTPPPQESVLLVTPLELATPLRRFLSDLALEAGPYARVAAALETVLLAWYRLEAPTRVRRAVQALARELEAS